MIVCVMSPVTLDAAQLQRSLVGIVADPLATIAGEIGRAKLHCDELLTFGRNDIFAQTPEICPLKMVLTEVVQGMIEIEPVDK